MGVARRWGQCGGWQREVWPPSQLFYNFCSRNKDKLALEGGRSRESSLDFTRRTQRQEMAAVSKVQRRWRGRKKNLSDVNLSAYQAYLEAETPEEVGSENKEERWWSSAGRRLGLGQKRQRRLELLEKQTKTLEESPVMGSWEADSSAASGSILSAFWSSAPQSALMGTQHQCSAPEPQLPHRIPLRP